MFIITFGEAEANKLIEKLERNTTNKYGAFHAVVNGIKQNEEDYIKAQKSIKHYGIIKTWAIQILLTILNCLQLSVPWIFKLKKWAI